MSIRLRIPPEQVAAIRGAARKASKTKAAFIMEAVNEKIERIENREQTIRRLAGWLSPAEASELRAAVSLFEDVPNYD